MREPDLGEFEQQLIQVLAIKAVALARDQQWADAINPNKAILRMDPKNLDTHIRLIEAHLAQKNYVEADQACRRALEIAPGNAIVLASSAVIVENILGKELAAALNTLYPLKQPQLQTAIGLTGYDDNFIGEGFVRRLIEELGLSISDRGIWQPNQIIVIGSREFDEDYLRQSVRVGLGSGFTCRYFSLSDFWRYLVTGEDPQYYPGDPRVRNHPGLWFLATIGFKWPSTNAPVGIGGTSDRDYSDASDLANYGYSVREGVSDRVRRAALDQAVTNMGLHSVVYWIADLVKWRKAQQGNRMAGAIARWEADLQWLRGKYYKGSEYSFIWPEY